VKTAPTSPQRPDFDSAQLEVLTEFARQVAGRGSAVRRVSYHLLGSEDLADRREASALLRALQAHDWPAAAGHQAAAGANNLLLGLLLRVEEDGGASSDYWVAMRSPFELMDWPSVVTCGKVAAAPPLAMRRLWERGD